MPTSPPPPAPASGRSPIRRPPRRTCCSKIGDAQSGNTVADIRISGDDEVTGDETAGQFCGSPGTYPIHFRRGSSADRSPPTAPGRPSPRAPNVFTQPTGSLDWGYHEVSSGGTTPTITPTTTSTGASAIAWQQATAEANTWIQANPPALTQGDTLPAERDRARRGRRLPRLLQRAGGCRQPAGEPHRCADDADGRHDRSNRSDRRTSRAGPHGGHGPGQPRGLGAVAPAGVGRGNHRIHSGRRPTAPPCSACPPSPTGKRRARCSTAPSGTEAKGGQSRTQVAGATGLGSGAWVTFDTTKQASVTMKVAISYVSQAGAWQNLRAEDPGWSTREVRGPHLRRVERLPRQDQDRRRHRRRSGAVLHRLVPLPA